MPESHRRLAVANIILHTSCRPSNLVMGVVGQVVLLRDAVLAAEWDQDLWSPTIFHLVIPLLIFFFPHFLFVLIWVAFQKPVERYDVKEMKRMNPSSVVDEKTAKYIAAAAVNRLLSLLD